MRQSHLIHTPTTTSHYIHIFSFHIILLLSNIIHHPFKNIGSFSDFASPSPPSCTYSPMASVNSSVLAYNYAISGAAGAPELNSKLLPIPSAAPAASGLKIPVIRAQQARVSASKQSGDREGRRAALMYLASTLFTTAAAASSANAGVIEDYLEKSKANKELNDKKRLATTGANFARAYTVEFGSCKFPENFTGCQDLAKQKKVPFLSDDLALECEGKDKYKCGSNVFWKW